MAMHYEVLCIMTLCIVRISSVYIAADTLYYTRKPCGNKDQAERVKKLSFGLCSGGKASASETERTRVQGAGVGDFRETGHPGWSCECGCAVAPISRHYLIVSCLSFLIICRSRPYLHTKLPPQCHLRE